MIKKLKGLKVMLNKTDNRLLPPAPPSPPDVGAEG